MLVFVPLSGRVHNARRRILGAIRRYVFFTNGGVGQTIRLMISNHCVGGDIGGTYGGTSELGSSYGISSMEELVAAGSDAFQHPRETKYKLLRQSKATTAGVSVTGK